MEGEKRFVPGTNPAWGVELPDNMDNSLVDKHGRSRDDGYNFDEPADEGEDGDNEPSEPEKTGWDEIAENS